MNKNLSGMRNSSETFGFSTLAANMGYTAHFTCLNRLILTLHSAGGYAICEIVERRRNDVCDGLIL